MTIILWHHQVCEIIIERLWNNEINDDENEIDNANNMINNDKT